MTNHYKSSYGTRDNCGIAAIDLMLFLQDMGFKAERIQGYFLCDIPVHNKRDFTKEMKNEFMMSGLDFNSKEDRLNWIKASKYFEEWLKCPHYWVVVEGEILDPSGVAQFIDLGLAKDLNTHRYLKI
jgi:hypothetical protein